MYQGRSVRGYQYVRPFDQKAIHYYMESLLAVVRFGGQGFVRIARANSFNRTPHPTLYAMAEEGELCSSPSSRKRSDSLFSKARSGLVYVLRRIDGHFPLVSVSGPCVMGSLLTLAYYRYLQSDPTPELSSTMSANNLRIQSTVLELIQGIVARGELDAAALETIESVIISRLYASVHANKLDLQNKLLHVLHSVIFAAATPSQSRRGSRGMEPESSSAGHRSTTNPLFVQMLIDALSRPSNRPVLQHWIDFVMMTVAQFPSLFHSVSPLCDCICRQLRVTLSELDNMISNRGTRGVPLRWVTSDSDTLLFLNALERLVLISLSKADDTSSFDNEAGPSERAHEQSTGILGYVFGSENPHQPDDEHMTV